MKPNGFNENDEYSQNGMNFYQKADNKTNYLTGQSAIKKEKETQNENNFKQMHFYQQHQQHADAIKKFNQQNYQQNQLFPNQAYDFTNQLFLNTQINSKISPIKQNKPSSSERKLCNGTFS